MNVFLILCWLIANVGAVTTRYVAPAALGSGTGTSSADTAGYLNDSFWSSVQALLNTEPVTVRFLDGDCNTAALVLTGMGHHSHRLTLQGNTDNGAILNAAVGVMLKFNGVQNTTISNLNFTGPIMSYAFHIEGRSGSAPSHDILIEACTFIDLLQVRLGELGTAYPNVYNITVRNCMFKRVGSGSSAHMMYNAYGPHTIHVHHNHFEDCAGDYLRFRDDVDFVEVDRNKFISTRPRYNRPFVSIPLFNDVNPGDETFATNYLIHNNRFTYQAPGGPQPGAIAFNHYGYEPADRNHLMTPAEGNILENGTAKQKKRLLLANAGIDGDKVCVYKNTFKGVRRRGVFGSFAAFGAVSKGWEGWANIHDVFRNEPPPALVYKKSNEQ